MYVTFTHATQILGIELDLVYFFILPEKYIFYFIYILNGIVNVKVTIRNKTCHLIYYLQTKWEWPIKIPKKEEFLGKRDLHKDTLNYI